MWLFEYQNKIFAYIYICEYKQKKLMTFKLLMRTKK